MEWAVICVLWIHGDNVSAPVFQNAVMDAFITKFIRIWGFPFNYLCIIYTNTAPGSKLRKVPYNGGKTARCSQENPTWGWIEEMLIDLVKALYTRPALHGRRDIQALDWCGRYHVHKEGFRCGGKSKQGGVNDE